MRVRPVILLWASTSRASSITPKYSVHAAVATTASSPLANRRITSSPRKNAATATRRPACVNLNADGTFDHTGITGGCSACHNGTVAIGTASDPSPSGHPSISVECNACHTTATFTTPFPNHSDPKVVVPGTCGQGGCHDGQSVMANGVAIPGKNSAPNPHPATGNITQACDGCHNTTTFDMGGVFDHGVLARHPIACKSCHDGLSATGMIAGHIPIAATADCSNCHNTSTFVGGFVDHTSSDGHEQAVHGLPRRRAYVELRGFHGSDRHATHSGHAHDSAGSRRYSYCRSRPELRQLSLGRRKFRQRDGGSQRLRIAGQHHAPTTVHQLFGVP